MDLNLFSNMLKELITLHDRVSVPGLGCFFAEDIPASFSDRGYTINPPYRRLSFRSGSENDGLLEELYRKSNPELSSREVSSAIGELVARIKSDLVSDRKVTLPGLGKLRATRENNLFFVADEDALLFPQYDFLEPVSLRTIKEQVQVAVSDPSAAPVEQIPAANVTIPEYPATPETSVEEPFETERRRMPALAVVLIILISLSVLFFAALAILGRTCPELIDPLLFTPEQIEIINQRI